MGSRRFRCGLAGWNVTDEMWVDYIKNQTPPEPDNNFNVTMYEDGQGVSQDYAAALRWFQKAADQGVHTAQFNLGLMYTIGRGVLQDYAAAMSWYRKAADQGDAEAQFNLGVIYANGQGVPRDVVSAHMWWNLAAANCSATPKVRRHPQDHREGRLSGMLIGQTSRPALLMGHSAAHRNSCNLPPY
jgi:hypothetical protein